MAITIVCVVRDDVFVRTTNGRCFRSTSSTLSSSKVAAKRIACRFISLMMSPPLSSVSPG